MDELRQRFCELRPLKRHLQYQFLASARVLKERDLVPAGESLTAVAQLQPALVAASEMIEVDDTGLALRMLGETQGQDYAWAAFEAVPAGTAVAWKVTATSFLGATGVGITTNKDDLDAIPGKQRQGVHVEYRRSGNVRFYNKGTYPYFKKHDEILTGDCIEMELDTARGTFVIRKDDRELVRFNDSTSTPICGLVWYPCVIFDEPGEEALLSFGSSSEAEP